MFLGEAATGILVTALAVEFRAAEADALERAAKVAEDDESHYAAGKQYKIAAAIRKLKEPGQ